MGQGDVKYLSDDSLLFYQSFESIHRNESNFNTFCF